MTEATADDENNDKTLDGMLLRMQFYCHGGQPGQLHTQCIAQVQGCITPHAGGEDGASGFQRALIHRQVWARLGFTFLCLPMMGLTVSVRCLEESQAFALGYVGCGLRGRAAVFLLWGL